MDIKSPNGKENKTRPVLIGVGCFAVKKYFSIFVLSGECALGGHIIDESVLAFILEWKSGKFQLTKESNTLVTLYCLVWGVIYPMLNTSVGYCLFGHRYSRTSIQID